MLRVIRRNVYSLKHPLYAALSLSFASFGDAFLYPFLPQYGEAMGVPLLWIGVLLSVNRFIRILFNPVVIKLFARYGVKNITVCAAIMAIASTMGYGLGLGLASLIAFRIIWGMAFAILRISTLAYAFEHEYIGLSMGAAKSIQEAGPMLALWLGPVLLNYFSIPATFFVLAIVSVPAVLYAIALPELKYVPAISTAVQFRLPSLFNTITFVSAFIIEGLLIIVTGALLAQNNVQLSSLGITALAAGYLAYRRICAIFISPVSGAIADRIGFTKMFNISVLMIIVGLVLLVAGWVGVGLIVVFTFNSINSVMAPGGASNNETDKIKAVTLNATWRDVGAAAGTLAGGFLLSGSLLFETFVIGIFILAILLFNNLRHTNRH